MQHGFQLNLLSGIFMLIYKAKCGEPYQNWTRLKCHNYVVEVGFRHLLVRKIWRPLGPIHLSFCVICNFLAQMAHPGQNPVDLLLFRVEKECRLMEIGC